MSPDQTKRIFIVNSFKGRKRENKLNVMMPSAGDGARVARMSTQFDVNALPAVSSRCRIVATGTGGTIKYDVK